jgi:hypothetical protein
VLVAVKGHGYGAVPENVLDRFGADAAPKGQGSAGVPENRASAHDASSCSITQVLADSRPRTKGPEIRATHVPLVSVVVYVVV